MRIQSIEIKNFRQYQDAKLEFKHVPGKCDIHVILGENGEGKTNILNAVTWCLYGEETHLGDKNNALPQINSQYANECREKGLLSGEISVCITIETDEGPIKYQRTATFSLFGKDPLKTVESCLVLDAKNNYFDDEDTVSMYVYRYFPQDINDYIFFDGEQLDDYFKEGKREKIETGIKDLTQATIVNRTITAFKSYYSKEIKPALDKADDNKVKMAQKKVEDLEAKVTTAQATLEETKHQQAVNEARLEELSTIIKGHENIKDKAILQEKLANDIDDCQSEINDKQTDLMKFTREYYVYFTLFPQMKCLYEYIEKQEKAGNLPPKVDKHLVEEILNTKECPICGTKHLDASHIEFVLSVLKRLEISSKTSNELNKTSVALREYFKRLANYKEECKRRRTSLLKAEKQLKKLEKEYEELTKFMNSIANSDKITKAINEREMQQKLHDELISKNTIESQTLNKHKADLELARTELDNAMKQNKAYAKLRKQKSFCEESIQLLNKTMVQVLNDCRIELQGKTFEKFQDLMWKKDTFKEVEIDENYIFHLKNMYDEEALGSCSAAERGLLALSFTMALQEVSRHDSLLYIDTPLGRVGVKNRINFSTVLTQIGMEKQVILSFTPTEYDENVKSILTGNYATYHELVYSNGLTSIKKK